MDYDKRKTRMTKLWSTTTTTTVKVPMDDEGLHPQTSKHSYTPMLSSGCIITLKSVQPMKQKEIWSYSVCLACPLIINPKNYIEFYFPYPPPPPTPVCLLLSRSCPHAKCTINGSIILYQSPSLWSQEIRYLNSF